MRFVVSVGCLVFSLMLTSFGIVNNAWIVLDRPNENDEFQVSNFVKFQLRRIGCLSCYTWIIKNIFQRGIRGHDCYRNNAPGNENIFCLPWDFEDKAEKFPDPFTKVLAASTGTLFEFCQNSRLPKIWKISKFLYTKKFTFQAQCVSNLSFLNLFSGTRLRWQIVPTFTFLFSKCSHGWKLAILASSKTVKTTEN